MTIILIKLCALYNATVILLRLAKQTHFNNVSEFLSRLRNVLPKNTSCNEVNINLFRL